MNLGYVRSLDGVRALAIILVMSFHANLNHFGWMGVQLFFVLSGFLITGILWKEKDSETPTSQKLKKFWVRRSLRIFPLYFGFLIVIGLVYAIFSFPAYFSTYLPYLTTYTFNYTRTFAGWQGNPSYTHFWSLSIEEQFYLFFPLIIFFAPKRFCRWFLLVMIVLSPLIRYLLFRYYYGHGAEVAADAVYWHTLSHLDAFFIGGAIPVFSLDSRIKRPQAMLAAVFVLVIAAGAINYFNSGRGGYPWTLGYGHLQYQNLEYVWHFSLLDILFGLLILNLVSSYSKEGFLARVLENRWLVSIGRVSYGMYIFHWAILVYVFNKLVPAQTPVMKLVLFVPYVALVFFVALTSYRLYESHFIRLKNRVFRDQGSKAPTKKIKMKY